MTHVAMMPVRRWASAIVVLALSAGLSMADPINPTDVYVIDGDTIRVARRTVRLVATRPSSAAAPIAGNAVAVLAFPLAAFCRPGATGHQRLG